MYVTVAYLVDMEFAFVHCMCFRNTMCADDTRCGLPCMHLSPDVLTLVVPLQLTSVRIVIQLYVMRREANKERDTEK